MGLNLSDAEKFNEYNARAFDPTDEDDGGVEFMYEPGNFEHWLAHTESRGKKRTRRTVQTTLDKCRAFFSVFETASAESVKEYRRNMLESNYAPATVNTRLLALNVFLDYLSQKYEVDLTKWRQKAIAVQQKQFIDNVISRADYEFLVENAKKDLKHPNLYLSIKVMGTTGLRISELMQVKVEHIRHGYVDVIGKGNKQRRIYFPKNARAEILDFLSGLGAESGYIMRHWYDQDRAHDTFTANTRDNGELREHLNFVRSVQHTIESAGKRYGIDPALMHAHGFRHFFAKEFLKHRLDIALLADLLGHSSLEITRIYLKMTSREQAAVVDETVTW